MFTKSSGNYGKDSLFHEPQRGNKPVRPTSSSGGPEEMVLASVISSHTRATSGGAEDIPLNFRPIIAGGASCLLARLQFSASLSSCSRMSVVFGRADGESVDSNSSCHIWVNNVHNSSENPTAGRSGRVPFTTFEMTAASGLVCSKGLRPVITWGGIYVT